MQQQFHKYRVDLRVNQIGTAGFTDESAGNLTASDLLEIVRRAALHPGQIRVSNKTACDLASGSLVGGFAVIVAMVCGGDGITVRDADDARIANVRAPDVKYAGRGTKQIERICAELCIVGGDRAGFAKMPDEAAHVVHAGHTVEVGDRRLLHRAIDQSTAEATGRTGVTLRVKHALRGGIMGDDLDAVVHAVDLTVIDEGAECFEHAHVADLEQFEQQVGILLIAGLAAADGSNAGYISKTKEATGVLPAFNSAQPVNSKRSRVIVRIRFTAGTFGGILVTKDRGLQRTSETAGVQGILGCDITLIVLALICAIDRVSPCRVIRAHMCTANRRNRGLQYADQTCRVRYQRVEDSLQESLGRIGVHIRNRTGSGHADKSADIVAPFHLAQVGNVGTGSGDTPDKLLAVLVEIAPDLATDRETGIASGITGTVRGVFTGGHDLHTLAVAGHARRFDDGHKYLCHVEHLSQIKFDAFAAE